MPLNSFRIKFAPGTIRKLNKEINMGIAIGADKYVKKLKKDLESAQKPDVWSATGPMQEALIKTGMDKLTRSGRLLEAWNATIDNIKIDKRSNNVVMNLFNSRILDEKTVWIGLKYRPKGYGKNEHGHKRSNRQAPQRTVPAIYNGGFRPLSRGKGNGWTWELNPYPEHGYWLLYEQGWGGYKSHNFIKTSYSQAFDASVADLLGETGKVAFSLDAIKNMKKMMTESINSL